MDFDLSDDHELIRRTVRDFAEGEVAPVAEELDRTKSFPYAIVKQLGDLGLMGIPFPEEYGGGGGVSLAAPRPGAARPRAATWTGRAPRSHRTALAPPRSPPRLRGEKRRAG